MYKSLIPWPNAVGRLVFAGAVLAGASACDDGGSTNASFDLDPGQLPTNVVANGSLEEGTELTGWSAYTNGDVAQAEFTVDTTDAVRGDNSFKATISALGEQPYDIEGGPVNVPVVAGETYALVAWTKGPAGGTANFTASLAQEPWTTFANQEVDFVGEWEQVAFTFTLPEDLAATTIRLPVQMNFEGNLGAEIYIDDLQLIPTDPPPPPPAGQVDLVTNGGLEASDTNADNWGSSGSNATFSVDSTEAYEGNNSFRIDFGTIPTGAEIYSVEAGPTGVPVTEGETYTYSAWVKGTGDATVRAMVQAPAPSYHTFASEDVVVTSEWQQVTFDATIAPAAEIGASSEVTVVRLYFHMAIPENSGQTVYIDNVQLLTQTSELVTNGGLEEDDSDATGWGGGPDSTADATLSVTSTEAYEGNNSYHIEIANPGDNSYSIETGPTGVTVTEGETYVFSAWVKGTVGATANFNVQLPEPPWHTFASQQVDVSGEWQEVTFEATIAEASTIEGWDGPTQEVRLYVQMGYAENAGVDIYLDSFSLTPQ